MSLLTNKILSWAQAKRRGGNLNNYPVLVRHWNIMLTNAQSLLNLKEDRRKTISTTAVDYEIVAADEDTIITVTAAKTINLPDDLVAGFKVTIINDLTGSVTFTADTTLHGEGGFTKLDTKYRKAEAIHMGSDVWNVTGLES